MIFLLLCLLPSAALFTLTIWPFGPPHPRSPLRWRPHKELCLDWSAGLSTDVFFSIRANVRPPSFQWIPTKLTSNPTSSYSAPASVLTPLQLFMGSPSTALFPFLSMYLRWRPSFFHVSRPYAVSLLSHGAPPRSPSLFCTNLFFGPFSPTLHPVGFLSWALPILPNWNASAERPVAPSPGCLSSSPIPRCGSRPPWLSPPSWSDILDRRLCSFSFWQERLRRSCQLLSLWHWGHSFLFGRPSMFKFFRWSLRHSARSLLVSAAPTSLPFFFSFPTVWLSFCPRHPVLSSIFPLISTSIYLTLWQIWQELYSLSSCSIRLQWVPGHSFLPGNDAADELTRQGALLAPSAIPCSLSPVISRIHSRPILDWRRTVSSKFFDTQISSISTLCSLVMLAVSSLV